MSLTAIVTGAASRIGLASAKLLLTGGHQIMEVIAIDPQEERMRNELPEHEGITYFGGDVSNSEYCSEVVAKNRQSVWRT